MKSRDFYLSLLVGTSCMYACFVLYGVSPLDKKYTAGIFTLCIKILVTVDTGRVSRKNQQWNRNTRKLPIREERHCRL